MENTMLIVDDGEINREVLKVLFSEKYAILEAESAEEALAVMEICQGNIDIILLDLVMGGMSGFELLKQRNHLDYFHNIPVVVITSSGAMEDQIRAFDLGANDFINKPFVPEIVISRVDNVMASHQRMLSIELEAQKLKVKSELDQMTGLYNKTTAEVTMNETLRTSSGKLDAMLVIDIDNFKSVNDISGHMAGDHVIRIVADLISSLFRKSDIVGRIGGDEFIVLMVDVPSMEIVRSKVNSLIQIMKYKPNLTIPENVTLSIGVSHNDRRVSTYSDLFKKADEALYMAKEDGKARYREYGITPVNLAQDFHPAILLISHNRSVCSVVNAMTPSNARIVEALEIESLDKIKPSDIEKICLVYADVSDIGELADNYWKDLKKYSWMDALDICAICEEGNMQQYSRALQQGVSDIFAAPLDSSSFKRRTMKKLEEFSQLES
ncbi:MAG: diguanylate cyclase [Lachnospiraceae bacterium]|nr:diguanylate cyclase [Lachnospiraceae bacterium]